MHVCRLTGVRACSFQWVFGWSELVSRLLIYTCWLDLVFNFQNGWPVAAETLRSQAVVGGGVELCGADAGAASVYAWKRLAQWEKPSGTNSFPKSTAGRWSGKEGGDVFPEEVPCLKVNGALRRPKLHCTKQRVTYERAQARTHPLVRGRECKTR